MKLSLGISPCPNDTFIFDALIHQKIDTEGLTFEVHYEDVERLNYRALSGDLDVTKLSYHAYAYVRTNYILLAAGSALGFGVGPLLISRNPATAGILAQMSPEDQASLKVGIPGTYTTANFLLGLAYPGLVRKEILVFSAIEKRLLSGEIDLGLIIHENRFTYQNKGLHLVRDLGDFWEKSTGSPIPLGGIVVKRALPQDVKQKINRVLRRSVQFAFDHPKSGLGFIRKHAQEMDESVMYKHIELYVNPYSVDLGEEGRNAVERLFQKASALNLIPSDEGLPLFLSSQD